MVWLVILTLTLTLITMMGMIITIYMEVKLVYLKVGIED